MFEVTSTVLGSSDALERLQTTDTFGAVRLESEPIAFVTEKSASFEGSTTCNAISHVVCDILTTVLYVYSECKVWRTSVK